MEQEIWKEAVGYEGFYEVSNLGRVRTIPHRNKLNQQIPSRIRIPRANRFGYLRVNLSTNGKITTERIHILVAKTFIPNPYNLPQVNHKNEDKNDNRADNLEWCTSKYNNNYGTRSERIAMKTRKPVASYQLDGTLVKVYDKLTDVEQDGYCSGAVSLCCNHKNKAGIHKGLRWKFLR